MTGRNAPGSKHIWHERRRFVGEVVVGMLIGAAFGTALGVIIVESLQWTLGEFGL